MKRKEELKYWQRVGRNVRPARFYAWFLGFFGPIAIGLSFFIGWHNDVVGKPTSLHLLMRAAIALAVFVAGMILFFHKVINPAIRAEKEEAEGRNNKET